MSNRLVPHAYAASLLPCEPESSLTFDMAPRPREILGSDPGGFSFVGVGTGGFGV